MARFISAAVSLYRPISADSVDEAVCEIYPNLEVRVITPMLDGEGWYLTVPEAVRKTMPNSYHQFVWAYDDDAKVMYSADCRALLAQTREEARRVLRAVLAQHEQSATRADAYRAGVQLMYVVERTPHILSSMASMRGVNVIVDAIAGTIGYRQLIAATNLIISLLHSRGYQYNEKALVWLAVLLDEMQRISPQHSELKKMARHVGRVATERYAR